MAAAAPTPAADLELPRLELLDPALRGERFERRIAELAAEHWLAQAELGHVVLTHAEGEQVLRTKGATFPGPKVAELFGVREGALAEQIRRNVLHLDGADHRRLRGLVNPSFTPRAAAAWRPRMRELFAGALEPFVARGGGDWSSAVAERYPALAIATVVGAPLEDAPRVAEWSNWIQRQFSADLAEHRDRMEQACAELYAYLDELIAARRARPRDDLVSRLLAAEQEGDRLSSTEAVNLVLNVLVGGVDTTRFQLAQAVRLLAEHPDQWAALRADPEGRARPAVDEVLRFAPVTPFTARTLHEPLELRGVRFEPEAILLVCAQAANRDPLVAGPDPQRFDLAVERPALRALTFGAGVHYCLGANLARAELEEALAHLATTVERLELDGEVAWGSPNGIYGPERLPVRLA